MFFFFFQKSQHGKPGLTCIHIAHVFHVELDRCRKRKRDLKNHQLYPTSMWATGHVSAAPLPLLVYFGSNENIIRKLKKSHQNSWLLALTGERRSPSKKNTEIMWCNKMKIRRGKKTPTNHRKSARPSQPVWLYAPRISTVAANI